MKSALGPQVAPGIMFTLEVRMVSAGQVASELREATTLSVMSLTSAVIAMAAVLGIISVFLFADSERQRDQHAWEERLGIVADTRAAEIDRWVLAIQTGNLPKPSRS